MEKHSYVKSKQENTTTICEKLKRAITTTSPLKAFHLTSNNQVHQQTTHIPPSPNVSLMTQTPLRDRCTRISNPSPTPLKDRCPRRPVGKTRDSDPNIPIIFRQSDDHPNTPIRNNVQNYPKTHSNPIIQTNFPKANISQTQDNVQNSPKIHSNPITQTTNPNVSSLPIHGIEHRIPTMSHVGEKTTIAESINGLFTEYIDRAGQKIRSPTIINGIRHDSFNDKVSDFINRAKHKFHTTPSLVDSSFKEKRDK